MGYPQEEEVIRAAAQQDLDTLCKNLDTLRPGVKLNQTGGSWIQEAISRLGGAQSALEGWSGQSPENNPNRIQFSEGD